MKRSLLTILAVGLALAAFLAPAIAQARFRKPTTIIQPPADEEPISEPDGISR